MSSFSYKTRGNSSPQGKSKVYFACHPEDLHLFEAISDDILREVNCAVFYHNSPIENEKEHLRDLSEMNVIVIPITTKFLTTPSAARDIEIPFSQQKHIPVLPLMQEPGLVDEFNKILGDIQFLDKSARDDTAISYEEKFKNFLTSILVGDELAEEIRHAFDAYIFLSYRKKDRAYAQELMRLIHENDFCRDVAIWYDEFLIPGENFNNTIADALQKSKLFALAVTPNLLEDPNYVMTTEYPMAKKAGKEILAAELVPTDKKALANAYPDLPRTVNTADPESLRDGLCDAFQWVMLRDHDDDPKHSYFIGLAYLSGIDVEKNPERALSLLTFAAESGLPEACEKLVSMYKTGEGVKRDYETAIRWQEKLVGICEDLFQKDKNEDTAGDCLSARSNLADCYEAVSDYTKAKASVLELLVWIDTIEDTVSDTFLDRNRASLYGKLGYYSQHTGDIEGANRYYDAMKHHSERLQKSSEMESERIRDFSLAWLEEARNGEEFSLPDEIWNDLAALFLSSADDYRIYARRELAQCYTALGLTALEESDTETAAHYFTEALSITEEIADRFTDAHSQKADLIREIAILHCYLGDIDKLKARYDEAYGRFEKANALFLTLASGQELPYDIATVWHRMAGIHEKKGEYDAALDLKLRALSLAQDCAEKTGTVQAYETLAASHGTLAFLCRDLGKTEQARFHAMASQEIIETCLSNRHELPPAVKSFYDAIRRLVDSLT